MSFALKPCATEKSVFDKEVTITPLWLIRKQEAERKAKEETERTRLQQEAERKAKELAEERIRRGTAEPVDLGLSVLWASHNIGARSSEQPGVYAAWTSKKEAINMWGEDWRLPTQQEMTELMQNCQWTWTVINGMPGFQIVAVNGNNVVVKGPKGQLELDVYEKLAINVEDNVLTVSRPDDERETRARHGLTRALIHNMVVGVSEGFEKKLELAGVGYRVQQKGKNLEFSLGFSHPVIVEAPEGITFEVPDNTHVNVKGINKQQVGQIAAEIRGHRPPEPYKGKGIHYVGEHIRRKLGKAAK